MHRQESENYAQMLQLERELMRKERQVEYLQMELKRYHSIIEELKQGMRPVGSIEEVRGDQAFVRLAGGQVFQVSIPPEFTDKISTERDAVLSPTRGVIVDVVERPKEKSIWQHRVEGAPKVRYEDVVGLANELVEFRKAVEWVLDSSIRERRQRIIKDGRMLEEAGSVLLFGPPGTGKTHIAKAVAGSISGYGQKTSFLKIEGYEIVSKWLGESARNVKEIFKFAREIAPTILFVDEVDAIGRARLDVTTDAGRDVQGMLNQLLIELGEGFDVNTNVAVVFATNLPGVIDPALMDRIKRVIYVRPPRTKREVKDLFDFYLSKVEFDPSLVEKNSLAENVFEQLWSIIRRRKQVFEATIPRREIRIRDEYSITPRDIKNIVQEAANDACFKGSSFVTEDELVTYCGEFVKEPRTAESAIHV